ncbi:MAG: serine/threonine protein kinase [Polyangiaceae bacterium]|nr:serine/threonine protein kinase [Polyangiaceae bacterium]
MAPSKTGSAGRPVPFGPFLLERRIAVGGSAEVFIARPREGNLPAPRLVVKKLLASGRDPERLNTLQQEAELHRAVRHPNVVEVFGAGVVGSEPYLAMEYVEGVDLYRLLRRAEAEQRHFPRETAIYVARRVALALSAVHTASGKDRTPLGIVHRDVTPSNVYLSVDGAVRLGDFGIARLTSREDESTRPGATLKGKFGYLSPEQVAGEAFDHRADLFALAVMLGEMLIGERVFPGSGQLAVLLAIRDGNVEPLVRYQAKLGPELYRVCLRGLARDPSARFQTGEEMAEALAPFEAADPEAVRTTLSRWVRWAADSEHLARRLEGQIRSSVERMRAARNVSDRARAPASAGSPVPAPVQTDVPHPMLARVRRADGETLEDVTFPRLMELIATGELQAGDEVELGGFGFRHIRDIDSLARHLLPSTTATTSRLFQPGVPDYQAPLSETPMLSVLAWLRQRFETGAVFVEALRSDSTRQRKEIYLRDGRLLHVASSEKAELLGEYLVRRGCITRSQLEVALTLLSHQGGRLGDTLVGMGVVEAMDVFRAIRDQGRDRVAALCAWKRGSVLFYRGTAPSHVEFPLDLDLASPMMAGVIVAARDDPCAALPDLSAKLECGERAGTTTERRERGTAPISLQLVPALAAQGISLGVAIERMTQDGPRNGGRAISRKEACAALVTAKILGWVEF